MARCRGAFRRGTGAAITCVRRGVCVLLALSAGAATASRGVAQDAESVVIRGLVAAARVPGARWPDFARYVDDVARLYTAHGGAPVWFAAAARPDAARAAIRGIAAAASHGLLPEDYDAVSDSVVEQLVTTGRTFDGLPEPPLSVDAAIDGRQLALDWIALNPLDPDPEAHYELGIAVDRDWQLVP